MDGPQSFLPTYIKTPNKKKGSLRETAFQIIRYVCVGRNPTCTKRAAPTIPFVIFEFETATLASYVITHPHAPHDIIYTKCLTNIVESCKFLMKETKMFYIVENHPKNVTFLQLDNAISHALNFLNFDCDDTLVVLFDDEVKPHQCGYFEYDEDDSELVIGISPALRGEELFKTIMHELVHARQILTGVYVPGEGNTLGTWQGVEYSGDYMSLPWEVEAYALEEQMYSSFTEIA